MHVRFAEVDENFIKTEVEHGFYTSETELVRDAVRRLREDKQRGNPFYAAVMKGVADIEAGRTTPLTPELMEELKQDGYNRARQGQPSSQRGTTPDHG